MNALTAQQVEIRHNIFGHIKRICSSNLPDSVKLGRCINSSNIYTALTGDDSLTPPALKVERQSQIDSLPIIFKTAEKKVKNKLHGIRELF